jgi:hypothetical protein
MIMNVMGKQPSNSMPTRLDRRDSQRANGCDGHDADLMDCR